MNLLFFLTPKDQTSYIEEDCTIRQALEKMDYHKFTTIPVIDAEGHYVSTLSEGDILRLIKNDCNFDLKTAEDTRLVDVARYRSYKALDINCKVEEVIEMSRNQNFIPMVDDRGMYIGMIKRKDVIDYIYKRVLCLRQALDDK